MKKLLMYLVIISMVLLLAAGCQTQVTTTKAGSTETTQGQTTQTEEETEKRYVLQFFTTGNFDEIIDQGYVETLFESWMPDCDFQWLERTEDPAAQVKMMISAGNIPDVWQDVSMTDYDMYVEEGVAREIPLDLLAEHTPGYIEYLTKAMAPMEDPWIYMRRNGGKVYGMPQLWSPGPHSRGLGIRVDWLENVGINSLPQTLDEYEEAIKAFTLNDPNDSGDNDTFGLTGWVSVNNDDVLESYAFVFGAFGVYPGVFIIDNNGKVVRGEVEPAAKDALTVLNRWYTEGYIDPEFMVNQRQNTQDKVVNERAGSLVEWWYLFYPVDVFFSGFFVENMKDTDAVWTTITPPAGPDGNRGQRQRNPVGTNNLFGVHLEEDHLIKYFQAIQLGAFNFEGIEAIYMGQEDVTFTRRDDGGYDWIEPYDDPIKLAEFGASKSIYNIGGCFNDYDLQMPFMTAPEFVDIRYEAEAKNIGRYDELQPVQLLAFNEHKDRLNQMATKAFIDFITGARNLDEFDAFVQEWYSLGGTEVMEDAQQSYDAMLDS